MPAPLGRDEMADQKKRGLHSTTSIQSLLGRAGDHGCRYDPLRSARVAEPVGFARGGSRSDRQQPWDCGTGRPQQRATLRRRCCRADRPKVLLTIPVAASHVELFDGRAYAAVGDKIRMFDLASGHEVDSLSLGASHVAGSLVRDGALLIGLVTGPTGAHSLRVVGTQARSRVRPTSRH